MVVADDGEHAAMFRSAGSIGMFEGIAGPVHTGGLAVPDAEQAIIFGARKQTELLAAPDGCGAQIFVQALPELDIMCIQPFLGGAQLLVIPTQRGSAIAGDEAGRVQAKTQIEAFSVKRQAYQCPS